MRSTTTWTRPDEIERPGDLVQSVSRALRVLEVTTASPGLPVKAIARRCGLNLSTTYHLARTLAYDGYLRRLDDGSYVAGSQVAKRFHDFMGTIAGPPHAHSVLQQLSERTGLSAYLGRLSDGQIVIADVVEGAKSPYVEDLSAGLDVATHATAMGKVLLSAMPAEQRKVILDSPRMRRFTSNTQIDRDELERSLQSLKVEAVVVERGEFRDDVVCAAVLVPCQAGRSVEWAVGMTSRQATIDDRALRHLQAASKELPMADMAQSVSGAATPSALISPPSTTRSVPVM